MNQGKIFPIHTKTACQLKWTWTTLFLHSGITRSCHRAAESKLSLEEFDNFHNTPRKIHDRETMLQGEWPKGGCEYCHKIELAGGSSDRMLHNVIPDLVPRELETDLTATNVTPRLLEIYLNNTCNLSCLYCHGELSSRINFENNKFNFQLGDVDLNKFTSFQIVDNIEKTQPAYIKKFWQWMEKNYKELKRIHVLGGEPFYQREFEDFYTFFENHPHPQLEFNVVSNLSIDQNKLQNYIERFKLLIAKKKIRKLEITCSIDCWGPEQEYVRSGLNLENWEENFNYLLDQAWLSININQTITPLTIKTMPNLLVKLKEWKKKKTVSKFFSGATPGPDYMKPFIFGGDEFREDFDKIFALMNDNTTQEKEAKKYMQGIWAEIEAAPRDEKEINNLKFFLNEIDRRRNTNWKELFPWIR